MVFTISARVLVVLTALLACMGCEGGGLSNAWFNAFLDPTQMGNFRDNTVTDIQRSISFRDTPLGIVGAEDPKPADLEAEVSEYEIGPGDSLQIGMLDFVQLGTETTLAPLVDELGYVDIPQIGLVRVQGRTARELQSDLIQLAKKKRIYNPEDTPTVTVVVTNPLQRMFNISGSIPYSGPYRIPRPDFRLREAIIVAGGMADTDKYVWVVRGSRRQKHVQERPAAPTNAPTPPAPGPSEQAPPPVNPVSMSDIQASPPASTPSAAAAPRTGTRPAVSKSLALPSGEVPPELDEAIRPPQGPAGTQPRPPHAPAGVPAATAPTAPVPSGTPAALPSYKFVNNAFIEVPAQPQQSPQPQAKPSTVEQGPISPMPPTSQEVGWDELASQVQQRIIRIPADKLRNGDPNFNIVIKHDDWIRVDPGPVGYYYMDGHVVRPGSYTLAGEQITLKQSIAAAGGLDQLAWPTRCEICRRLDSDREEITQWDLARIVEGRDPDLYLKPNDVIRVGTHAIAPLLATIRNSFRFTYGFGFVYDRNFADIDSFSSQANPRDVRRTEKAARFGGLANLIH